MALRHRLRDVWQQEGAAASASGGQTRAGPAAWYSFSPADSDRQPLQRSLLANQSDMYSALN
jgi:hypothetical protein